MIAIIVFLSYFLGSRNFEEQHLRFNKRLEFLSNNSTKLIFESNGLCRFEYKEKKRIITGLCSYYLRNDKLILNLINNQSIFNFNLHDSTITKDNRLDSILDIHVQNFRYFRLSYKVSDSSNIQKDSFTQIIKRINEFLYVNSSLNNSSIKVQKIPKDSTIIIFADSYYAIRYNDFFHRKIIIGEDYNFRKHFFDKYPEFKSAILMKDNSGIKIIWKNGKSEFLNLVR